MCIKDCHKRSRQESECSFQWIKLIATVIVDIFCENRMAVKWEKGKQKQINSVQNCTFLEYLNYGEWRQANEAGSFWLVIWSQLRHCLEYTSLFNGKHYLSIYSTLFVICCIQNVCNKSNRVIDPSGHVTCMAYDSMEDWINCQATGTGTGMGNGNGKVPPVPEDDSIILRATHHIANCSPHNSNCTFSRTTHF